MTLRRILLLILLTIVIAVLQLSFFNVFFGNDLNPNILLAFVFGLLLADLTKESFISSFIGGVIIDMLGVGIIGFTPTLIALLILLAVFLKKYFFKNWFFQLLMILFFYILFTLLTYIPFFYFKPIFLLQAVFTLAITIAITFITKRSFQKSKKYSL